MYKSYSNSLNSFEDNKLDKIMLNHWSTDLGIDNEPLIVIVKLFVNLCEVNRVADDI